MSKPRPRPLLIGILIVGVMLVPALAGRGLPTYAEMLSAPPRDITDFDFTLDTGGTPDPFVISVSRFASGTGIAQFLLNNRQAVSGTIVVDIPNLPDGWTATFSPPPRYTFPASSTILYISLKLTVPANTPSTEKTLQVRATSLISQRPGRPLKSRVAPLTVKVVSGPPIAGTGCPDTPAPGADFDHARLLHVDTIERHGLCETGEQDWFKFGAVGGKYYTIEITQADDGLDLAIDVFDDHHNQLTSNDDFPFRPTPTPTGTPTPSPLPNTTPTATPAAPATIMPRIKSFRAPRDGLYYIRVRDAADVGGDNATYEIVVQSESYGAEPVQVPEICNDRYEPDGLPENARLLTANQTQEEHRLCPTGDADWVKFFGHSGMTYALFTNTKKYATTRRENDKDIIINTEPGADTVLSLFGTDGRTFWDTNDNAQGLPTTDNPVLGSKAELDSNILFTPPADGYYYAQVKNGGDVGDQQIRYDLTLTVCP